MPTPAQIRAARALLGWKQATLAEKADISATGLNNIETGKADPKTSTLRAIRSALEEAGVDFLPDDGVRRRRVDPTPEPPA